MDNNHLKRGYVDRKHYYVRLLGDKYGRGDLEFNKTVLCDNCVAYQFRGEKGMIVTVVSIVSANSEMCR